MSIEPTPKEPTPAEAQLYNYWFNCVKRAKKNFRTKQWDAATERIQCKEKEGLPYVNGARKLYEGLKSFLDQKDANFKVLPAEAFMNDEIAVKKAECNEAYLKAIWSEQHCQVAESQKLDSTLQKNIGFTYPTFDKKKWMPKVKYLPVTNVLLDPDCGGIHENASWIGYREEISLEKLKGTYELNEEELKNIKNNAGSVLSDDDQKEITDDGEKRLYTTVEVYHIFARNDAAIRLYPEDGEEKLPSKSIVDELELATPKRYLQFVKGYHKPLSDGDWPYELDDDEFPITMLRFNTPVESLYGFTDNEHMNRLDLACDDVMGDIQKGAYWAGNKKFAGTPGAAEVAEQDLNTLLLDPKIAYLKSLLGPDGNLLVKMIDVGGLSPDIVKAYEILNNARNEASLLGELISQKISEYKDVTAFSAKVHQDNAHQKINRRLGGPEGYEASIQVDAVKMLEIAHQVVPKVSLIEAMLPVMKTDGFGEEWDTGEIKLQLKSMKWEKASKVLLQPDSRLVYLGVDAIVGKELAEAWETKDEYSARHFKLSMNVRVVAGSTRSITEEQRAAMIEKYYLEVFSPLFVAMGRFDLAFRMAEHIGELAGIKNVEDFTPEDSEVKEFMEQTKQLQEAQAQEEQSKQLGGPMPQVQASPQQQVE